MDAIVEAQRLVLLNYFEYESVEAAYLPVKALLHIMAFGHYEGMLLSDPHLRESFTRESLLESEWYKNRLRTKQLLDIALWTRHRDTVRAFLATGVTRVAASVSHVAHALVACRVETRLDTEAAHRPS